MCKPPGFLVLAAGRSRRFGSDKLAADFQHGRSVFWATLDQINRVSSKISVVCSPGSTHVQQICAQQGVDCLVMSEQSQGLGCSLAWGVQKTADWPGWIVCLADMPNISANVYARVLHESANAALLAPHCGGSRGHPVYFQKSFYSELVTLQGDSGAKKIIEAHGAQLKLFSTDCKGILEDIDYPSDLLKH